MVKISNYESENKTPKILKKSKGMVTLDHSTSATFLVAKHIPLDQDQQQDNVVQGLIVSTKKTKKASSKDKKMSLNSPSSSTSPSTTTSICSVATDKATTRKKKKKTSNSIRTKVEDEKLLVPAKSTKSTISLIHSVSKPSSGKKRMSVEKEVTSTSLQLAARELGIMKGEMKELEPLVQSRKAVAKNPTKSSSKTGKCSRKSEHNGNTSSGSRKTIVDDMEHRVTKDKRKRLERREAELEKRTNDLRKQEQILLDREDEMAAREQELVKRADAEIATEMEKIRLKELWLKERERELQDLDDRLTTKWTAQEEREWEIELRIGAQEQKAHEQEDALLERSLGEIDMEENTQVKGTDTVGECATSEIALNELNDDRNNTMGHIAKLLKRVTEHQIEISELREENEALKYADAQRNDRENELQAKHSLEIQIIQEGNNKQIQELYEEICRIKAEYTVVKEHKHVLGESIGEEGIDLMNHATAGLCDENARLREAMVAKEQQCKTLRDEISVLKTAMAEHSRETTEFKLEITRLETIINETKATSPEKMTHQADPIAFLQKTIFRIRKDESEVEKNIHSREFLGEKETMKEDKCTYKPVPEDEEQESAEIQAFFHDEIAALNSLNEELQKQLETARFQHEFEVKEKNTKILEMEEEIADCLRETRARNEADYLKLLEVSEQRKRECDAIEKDLQNSNQHATGFQCETKELIQNHDGLGNDNKSVVANDSDRYASGLKQQIRSLKQHNMTLERTIEVESFNMKEILRKKDAMIASLDKEIRELNDVRVIYAFASCGDTAKDRDVAAVKSKAKAFPRDHLCDSDETDLAGITEKKTSSSPTVLTPQRMSTLWSTISTSFTVST